MYLNLLKKQSVTQGPISSSKLKDIIVAGMQEKKATDIAVIDLKNIKNAISDYFVICNGNSDTQIDAIKESIEKFTYQQAKQDAWQKEGSDNREWVLLDYVDVVAHIFKKDRRKHFALEELWGDAEITFIPDAS